MTQRKEKRRAEEERRERWVVTVADVAAWSAWSTGLWGFPRCGNADAEMTSFQGYCAILYSYNKDNSFNMSSPTEQKTGSLLRVHSYPTFSLFVRISLESPQLSKVLSLCQDLS